MSLPQGDSRPLAREAVGAAPHATARAARRDRPARRLRRGRRAGAGCRRGSSASRSADRSVRSFDDLHRVGELAVPVAVVGGVHDDVLAERSHDVRDALLVGVAADEAAARRGSTRSACGRCSAPAPASAPSARRGARARTAASRVPASRNADAQLREAVQDAADRERHHRHHLADRVREGVHLEARVASGRRRSAPGRWPGRRRARRPRRPSSSAVRHTTSKLGIVEVLVAHVLRRDHADHAELRDARGAARPPPPRGRSSAAWRPT